MNILLLGGGGREHALAWRLAQSPSCTRLYAAPGNPGIAAQAICLAIDLHKHDEVTAACRAHAIDLVVVGPEAPLVDGIADSLQAAGIAVFGPSRAAAQLEGSKFFTKRLCDTHGIATAAYEQHTTLAAAMAALDRFGLPVVIKADGLAAGKGVTIATTRTDAVTAVHDLFAQPDAHVVIEAFLQGEEVSLFAITDGITVVPFGTAQDHKRVGDGDTGPNTGGMGAYSPAAVLTPALEARAMAEIVRPTVAAMAARGTPFVGILYAGLILTDTGPQLIEYNVRLGDPEAQVLLPRYLGDLAALMHDAAHGRLIDHVPQFSSDITVGVVLAARGYPAAPVTGGLVGLPEALVAPAVFLAGVAAEANMLVASGGRVLATVGTAPALPAALDAAYATLATITYADGFYRSDIGGREIARSHATGDDALTMPVLDAGACHG